MTIKNLHLLGRQLTSLLLIGGISISTSACGSKRVELEPLHTLMQQEEVLDRTILDELTDYGYLHFGNNHTILEDAIQLERMLEIKDNLSTMDFRELRNAGYKYDEDVSFQTITNNEIEKLKTTAKMFAHNSKELEQRTNALKKLYAVDELTKEWIAEHGKEIVVLFMITSVRTSVANNLDISLDEFSRVNILDQKPAENKESYYVIIDDEKYEIKKSKEELWDTIHYMFQLKERKKPIGKEYDIYKKGLELAKTTIAAGSRIKKNTISNDRDLRYVEKHFAK